MQNTKLAWRLCRATQHFDDGTSKCKIWALRQVYMIYADWRSIKISFTPLMARGMEKITGWRGRKIFLATQKNMAFITESPLSNKILQIRKNNSVFILFLQNKSISLQRNSRKQPLAVSHWRSSEIQTKNKTLNTMQRSNPPNRQIWHTRTRRLKDAMPKANSRGLLSPWKQKRRRNGVCKDAERQRVRGLKSPSVLKSPSSRRR